MWAQITSEHYLQKTSNFYSSSKPDSSILERPSIKLRVLPLNTSNGNTQSNDFVTLSFVFYLFFKIVISPIRSFFLLYSMLTQLHIHVHIHSIFAYNGPIVAQTAIELFGDSRSLPFILPD